MTRCEWSDGTHGLGPQSPQSSHTPSTGQGEAVHPISCRLRPLHSLPPFAANMVLTRVRPLVPSPQKALHLDQPVQDAHSQFTGQGSVLHSSHFSCSGWHSSPPCSAALSTVRTFFTDPPPQVCEHVPVSVQPESTHATGQGCVLQGTDRSKSAGQASPPWSELTVIWRDCGMEPVPHCLSQGPVCAQAVERRIGGIHLP